MACDSMGRNGDGRTIWYGFNVEPDGTLTLCEDRFYGHIGEVMTHSDEEGYRHLYFKTRRSLNDGEQRMARDYRRASRQCRIQGLGPIICPRDTVHNWFELSYARYLTIPRSILQQMPADWQRRFVQCLEELDATFDWRPRAGRYYVELKDARGRYTHDPLADYRHTNFTPQDVAHLREGAE